METKKSIAIGDKVVGFFCNNTSKIGIKGRVEYITSCYVGICEDGYGTHVEWAAANTYRIDDPVAIKALMG